MTEGSWPPPVRTSSGTEPRVEPAEPLTDESIGAPRGRRTATVEDRLDDGHDERSYESDDGGRPPKRSVTLPRAGLIAMIVGLVLATSGAAVFLAMWLQSESDAESGETPLLNVAEFIGEATPEIE